MLGVCITRDSRGLSLDQWNYVLCHIRPDVVYVLGGRPEEWLVHNPLKLAVDVETAADLPPDSELVVLAPANGHTIKGTVPLDNFVHPASAVYLFGSNHQHLEEARLGGRVPDHLVYIPTDTDDQMYSWVSCAVTLYDRRLKELVG